MTYATQTATTPHLVQEGNFLERAWTGFWVRRTQRATVRLLQDLDDLTLRDIGVSRSEIDSVVYGDAGDRRVNYSVG